MRVELKDLQAAACACLLFRFYFKFNCSPLNDLIHLMFECSGLNFNSTWINYFCLGRRLSIIETINQSFNFNLDHLKKKIHLREVEAWVVVAIPWQPHHYFPWIDLQLQILIITLKERLCLLVY